MKLRLLLAGCMLIVSMATLSAAPLAPAKPTDAGMSAEVLKQAVALYEKAVADDEVRGVVLLVAREGKVVIHQALGWRDKDGKLPMEKDTLFHVASNTKPIVASAVLLLAEEGKLRLDDPVGKYLPAFDNDRWKEVNIRHLLSHTSGLRIPTIFLEPLMQKSAEHPDAPSLRLEVNRFAAIGPKEKPGATYSYNNPGYNILGAIIETVSKQPIDQFLTERFYKPLGMNDSMHMDRKDMVARRSCIYNKKEGAWQAVYRPGDPPKYPFVRSSGGLITTAADYAKFLQMYLDGGKYDGKRILKNRTVCLATTPHTQSLHSEEELKKITSFYGFGWTVDIDGGYAHGGSDGTFAWVDPDHDIIGIVFTQSPGGKNPRAEFRKLVTLAITR